MGGFREIAGTHSLDALTRDRPRDRTPHESHAVPSRARAADTCRLARSASMQIEIIDEILYIDAPEL